MEKLINKFILSPDIKLLKLHSYLEDHNIESTHIYKKIDEGIYASGSYFLTYKLISQILNVNVRTLVKWEEKKSINGVPYLMPSGGIGRYSHKREVRLSGLYDLLYIETMMYYEFKGKNFYKWLYENGIDRGF